MSRRPQGGSCKPVGLRALLVAIATAILMAPALAASVDGKKEELQDLKGRIDSLRRELAAGEESKAQAADKLREAEQAISDTNRRIRELGRESAALKGDLATLETQAANLDRDSGAQRERLARLLNRQFAGGDSDALALILAGRDPNQAARDKHFLTLLSQAKADLITRLRTAAAEKKRLADAVRERHALLADLQRQEQEQRSQLVTRKQQRQSQLAVIAGRLKTQRKEIATLKRDERRLTKLIDGLIRITATRKPRAAKPPSRQGAPRLKDNDPGRVGGEFAALRGRLTLPLRGKIAGRFGMPREEGGALWKGIFIQASEGAEVKAVAGGSVVFSDWLRGFGNLLVIDHGDDFHSVYGNNEALLVTVGASIARGQVVATAGNSGGNPDSGLYFELRHRGLAFDPMKWAVSP